MSLKNETSQELWFDSSTCWTFLIPHLTYVQLFPTFYLRATFSHILHVQLFPTFTCATSPHFCFIVSQLYFWIFCHEQIQVSDDWRPEVVVGTAGIFSGAPTLPQIWLSCILYYILYMIMIIYVYMIMWLWVQIVWVDDIQCEELNTVCQ